MARARVARFQRPVKKINTLRWIGIQSASLAQSAGSIAVTAIAAGTPAETVMRTRGELSCWFDGTPAPGEIVLVSCGLVVVPEGQGTTVIWDPFNDPNAPWFWFEEFTLGYEEMVIDVIDVPAMSGVRKIVDSKAMRKTGPDEEVQFVVTNTTLSGGQDINTSLTGRLLAGH